MTVAGQPMVGTTRRPRHAHGLAVTALTLWAVSVVFVAISLVTVRSGGDLVGAVGQGLVAFSFATVGAILASRLPRNVIGWLLVSGGLCFAVGGGATSLGTYGLVVHPGSIPGAIWFAWLSEWIWAPAFGAVVLLVLVYPSGRLLSARWWPVAVAAVVLIALITYSSAVGPWTDGTFPVQNPLATAGAAAPGPPGPGVLGLLVGLITLLVPLLAVASLVIRYRRAAGVERAQLKWFAAVVAISIPAFLVSTTLYGATGVAGIGAEVAGLASFGGFALLPVAIGIAILRYRLYEIDRLISRTISWAVVTVLVAGLFVGLILALQAVLAPLTQSNELAVAGSTLLVFSLFAPIRRRVQRLVDRRFNRSRYDSERTVAAFASRLRDEVDLEHLRAEILATVSQAVEPTSVSLWLRG